MSEPLEVRVQYVQLTRFVSGFVSPVMAIVSVECAERYVSTHNAHFLEGVVFFAGAASVAAVGYVWSWRKERQLRQYL